MWHFSSRLPRPGWS